MMHAEHDFEQQSNRVPDFLSQTQDTLEKSLREFNMRNQKYRRMPTKNPKDTVNAVREAILKKLTQAKPRQPAPPKPSVHQAPAQKAPVQATRNPPQANPTPSQRSESPERYIEHAKAMSDLKYRDAHQKFYGQNTGNSFERNAAEFYPQTSQKPAHTARSSLELRKASMPSPLPVRTSRNTPMYSPVKVTGAKRLQVEQGILGLNPATM